MSGASLAKGARNDAGKGKSSDGKSSDSESAREGAPASRPSSRWMDVCALDDIPDYSGVAALVDGKQIALIRLADERVFALSNYDPFSQAFVISRGIVGDRDGTAKIASPIFKQNFALETGVCLDDPMVVLPSYPVRVHGGRVQVASQSVEGEAIDDGEPSGATAGRPHGADRHSGESVNGKAVPRRIRAA